MSMRLAVYMDDIKAIKPEKDTSFAIMMAALQAGWDVDYLARGQLSIEGGRVYSQAQAFSAPSKNGAYQLGDKKNKELVSSYDVLLIRTDPPVDESYITDMQMLMVCEQQGLLIVNRPGSVLQFNEKLSTQFFPQCCPPNIVSAHVDKLKAFLAQQEEIVLKKLDSLGGQGIFYLHKADKNVDVLLAHLTQGGRISLLAQSYLPAVKSGDKRIFVLNGEPVSHGLSRKLSGDGFRANIDAGGEGVAEALTDRDLWLVQQVAPALRDWGLPLVGLDVIGDYITEINVTSPTCACQISQQADIDVPHLIINMLKELFVGAKDAAASL